MTSRAMAAAVWLVALVSLAGGAEGGHRVLLDSNYDWGQHDGALREHLAGVEEVVRPVDRGAQPLVQFVRRICKSECGDKDEWRGRQ